MLPLIVVAFACTGILWAQATRAALPDYELDLESQWFPQDAVAGKTSYSGNQHASIAVDWKQDSDDGRWLFELDAFIAWDQRDDHRQRADMRTFALNYYAQDFNVKAGVVTEFWGVTESRHLVDILNQTSLADNIDEEVKLGQPMVKWQTQQDWGNVQFFWLPAFRERLYPEAGNRLTPVRPVDDDTARFASGAKKMHQDFAMRYTNSFGAWDLGLAAFKGTGREPLLDPFFTASGDLVLSPYYEQIDQASLDLQYTSDGLLLKLEALQRHGSRQGSYRAAVAGFEYTQIGLLGSAMDMGYLVEYLYDQRDEQASTPFADDIFLALRLVANNIAQSSVLLGVYQDAHGSSQSWRLEMDTRLSDNLILQLEGQAFRNTASTDLLHNFRQDDYVCMTLRFYF